jgi:large subunit ribosomal protein L22
LLLQEHSEDIQEVKQKLQSNIYMGARKRKTSEEHKAMIKTIAYAKLNNCPTSPRKMRLVADMIRGRKVENALTTLRYSTKEASGRMQKLVLSAISNWQTKNEGERIEDHELFVSEVYVDSARQLKRLRTAPPGRGHRIRKRSNHITLILDSKTEIENVQEEVEIEEEEESNQETAK